MAEKKEEKHKGAWFWGGVVLLLMTSLLWLMLIVIMIAEPQATGWVILAGVLISVIPVGLGFYGLRRGIKSPTIEKISNAFIYMFAIVPLAAKNLLGSGRSNWFRAGVILLFISGLLWLLLLLVMSAKPEDTGSLILAGVIVTALPVGIGIYGVRHGRKAPVAKIQKANGATYATQPIVKPAFEATRSPEPVYSTEAAVSPAQGTLMGVLFVKAGRRKKIWEFTLEDGKHTVVLEHGYFSGKRKITVDGAPIIQTGKHIIDAGSMHDFTISGVPCQVLIETKLVTLSFKYSLYVDGKPVDREMLRNLESIRQMRDSFGPSKIYLTALLLTFLFIFMPVGMLVGAWFTWHNIGGWERYFLVAFMVALAGFLLYCGVRLVPPPWRDAFGGTTILSGRISRKWITEETVVTGGYGGATAKTTVKHFRLVVNSHEFPVSRRLYDWLSMGDEVVVHYWPRSNSVSKVMRLSA